MGKTLAAPVSDFQRDGSRRRHCEACLRGRSSPIEVERPCKAAVVAFGARPPGTMAAERAGPVPFTGAPLRLGDALKARRCFVRLRRMLCPPCACSGENTCVEAFSIVLFSSLAHHSSSPRVARAGRRISCTEPRNTTIYKDLPAGFIHISAVGNPGKDWGDVQRDRSPG